ncbi:MAG: endoglucanase [Lachnospiraceae bacterium]|nr:endoglucanase [Lachnospiraceae bacterium]
MKKISYTYYNAPIPGGGYVTGFAFDDKHKGILYCRTDIGGCYRYSYEEGKWVSLSIHVGMEDLSETFPIAIAVADERLYVACGYSRKYSCDPDDHCGRLCISDDKGESFIYEDIPCFIHGNLNGRGTGKRLVAGPSGKLYFASQCNGLGIRGKDGTWSFKAVCGEMYLTCAYVSADEKTIVAGTAGVTNKKGERRGHSLYVSRDGGESFVPVAEPEDEDNAAYSGYVAHRLAADDEYLYVTFSASSADAYAGWMAYSCDGGWLKSGKVVRYAIKDLSDYEDITPGDRPCGFGGIAVNPRVPGMVAAASLCAHGGDSIWVSRDKGLNWEVALHDMDKGNMSFRTDYLRPECHDGHSPVHWMSDLAINPYDADELWFNTGTGVFVSRNFTEDERSFCDCCEGIEETVHLNLYSPPSGEVQLIDILGDLGGFAFRDLHKACKNSFADDKGNRYITCINADFPDKDPSRIAVAARGNWVGITKGGIILSQDGAESWERLPLPYGIDDRIDEICRGIERPNVNPGWVAMSADGSRIVYTLAEGICLWADNAICDGKSVKLEYLKENSERSKLKIMSDRTDPDHFYGFGDNSRLYVSSDGGRSFKELPSPLPEGIDFGLIDCADRTQIR